MYFALDKVTKAREWFVKKRKVFFAIYRMEAFALLRRMVVSLGREGERNESGGGPGEGRVNLYILGSV